MFLKIWLSVIAAIQVIENTLNQAMQGTGVVALSTGMVMLLVWVYAAWKFWELWVVTADDTFVRKMWYIFKEYRRMATVYLLVLVAPVLTVAIGGMAVSFARMGRARVVESVPAVFGSLDSVLGQATCGLSIAGDLLEAHAGGKDVTEASALQRIGAMGQGYSAAARWTSGAGAVASPVAAPVGVVAGMVTSYKAVGAAQDANVQRVYGTGGESDRGFANVRGGRKAVWNASNKLIESAIARGNTQTATRLKNYQTQITGQIANSAEQAQTSVTSFDPTQARSKHFNTVWWSIQNQWMQEYGTWVANGRDPKQATEGSEYVRALKDAKETPEALAMFQDKVKTERDRLVKAEDDEKAWSSNIPRIGWQLIGIVGILICCVGIIACAVNVFKAAYGAVLYAVGFVATVIFAITIAAPLSPAFALCFISDKTEPYGRNYVNFLFGAVFAAMGMSLMAKAISGLFSIIALTILSEGTYYMNLVLANTFSIGQFLLHCLMVAGVMMISGMAFTYVSDFIKKGAAVGAGIFTGHFPS